MAKIFKKKIRLNFYYADESVWEYVKKNTIKKRLIKWANDFYSQYNFEMDEEPIPYNEQLYKKTFSLARTNGIKLDYTTESLFRQKTELIDSKIKELEKEMESSTDPLVTDPPNIIKMMEYLDQKKAIRDEFLTISPEHFVSEFRRLIFNVNKKLKAQKERLPVVFCEFIGLPEGKRTIGEVFKNENTNTKRNSMSSFSWGGTLLTVDWMYIGPLIFIDSKRIAKEYEWVLAHEIVHAAGNTTHDNKGSAGNIMIYADATGKAPLEVSLESSDKTKLESAFFVVK